MDTTYDAVSVAGGWYTDCDGKDEQEIYGQVTHYLGDIEYKLTVGVEFSGNSYIQEFDNSLEYRESDESAE